MKREEIIAIFYRWDDFNAHSRSLFSTPRRGVIISRRVKEETHVQDTTTANRHEIKKVSISFVFLLFATKHGFCFFVEFSRPHQLQHRLADFTCIFTVTRQQCGSEVLVKRWESAEFNKIRLPGCNRSFLSPRSLLVTVFKRSQISARKSIVC